MIVTVEWCQTAASMSQRVTASENEDWIFTVGEAAFKLEAVPMPNFSGGVPDKPPRSVLSVQGEQQQDRQLDLFMPQEEVDKYVDGADDAIITCRERGRHPFPSVRETGLRFNGGVDADTGLMIRRVMCPCCELVERIEFWDIQHRGNKVTRCEFVSATVIYHTQRRKDGTIRRYAAPAGHGRIRPKQVKNAVATGLLGGMNYRALLKEAKEAGRANTR